VEPREIASQPPMMRNDCGVREAVWSGDEFPNFGFGIRRVVDKRPM
jgi:hypothetical protein